MIVSEAGHIELGSASVVGTVHIAEPKAIFWSAASSNVIDLNLPVVLEDLPELQIGHHSGAE